MKKYLKIRFFFYSMHKDLVAFYEKNRKSLGEEASKFAHKNLGLNRQALIMDRIFQGVISK